MRKITAFTFSAIFSLNAYAAEISGTVAFTNDYRFAGISQTSGEPATQGSLDVFFENGVYAGAWGSNVEWGDDAHLEIDYYVGHFNNFYDDFSYDIGLAYYTYPGYGSVDGDYAQLNMTLHYKNASIWYGYADNYFNTGQEGHYLSIDYSHPIFENVNIDLHASKSFGGYWSDLDPAGEYTDYSLGFSSSILGLDLSAAWVMTDTNTDINSGAFRNDDALIAVISRSF